MPILQSLEMSFLDEFLPQDLAHNQQNFPLRAQVESVGSQNQQNFAPRAPLESMEGNKLETEFGWENNSGANYENNYLTQNGTKIYVFNVLFSV